MRYLLFPFSVTYAFFVNLRNLFYDIGVFKTRRLPCFVISVGNLTVGGTGKTPTVIALAKYLREQNISVAVLSRGYGRTTAGTIIVSDGKSCLQDWKSAGDEPILIANKLSGVPVVVDENRFRGGTTLLKKFNPDVIILDDGFQHRKLFRDVNILLINSQFQKKDQHLLPVGNLREPWSQAKRADMLFLTKTNLFKSNRILISKAAALNKLTYKTTLESDPALNTNRGSRFKLSNLSGKQILAVSAVGSPSGFERSLQSAGLRLTSHLIFRDHHAFTSKDVEKIIQTKIKTNSDVVITTDKDLIKLKPLSPYNFSLYSLPVDVIIPKDAIIQILSQLNQHTE